MLRYFFDPTSIQTFPRLRRFYRIQPDPTQTSALNHRSHTVDRTNTSQTSLGGRQSRAATPTHRSSSLGVLQPHLRSVLVGWMQLREKALPATFDRT
jgi:hypothetical protein